MHVKKTNRFFFGILLATFFLVDIGMPIKGEEAIPNIEEIKKLNEICIRFENSNYTNADTLLHISNLLLQDKYLSNNTYKAFGQFALAERAYYQQNFKESLRYYEASLPLFMEIADTLRIANNLNSIGVVNFILCNDDNACEAYLKAFALYRDLEDEKGMAKMYHNLALIYWRSNNFIKSDFYGLRAIEIYEKLGETDNLASMYNNYAVNLAKRKNFSLGLFYYQKAIPLYKKTSNKRGESSVIFNIGVLFEHKLQYDSAYSYFQKAHLEFTKMKDTLNLINSYQKLAMISEKKGDNILAIDMLLIAEQLNKKIGDKEFDSNINYDLSRIHEKLLNYSEALKRYKLYILYSDTIKSQESQTKIAEVESKFLVDQTQRELKLAKQESRIKTSAIIIILLLFIIIGATVYFYWHHFALKEERRVLMLEHKVLRTQMDPHFIFNSLSALQCYIMDDKPEDAIRFLSDFSALLRLVLQYSKSELVPISKEKKILDYYLALQNKRFDNRINFSVEIDDNLLTDEVLIPPMLAQPFIENSLEHAGLDRTENASIVVSFTKTKNNIRLSITDNGIGIEKSLLKPKEDSIHKSMAISITHERLKLINAKQKEKVDLEITDQSRVGLSGTKVEFTIPIQS